MPDGGRCVMYPGNFVFTWMPATIFLLLVSFPVSSNAADADGGSSATMEAENVGVTLTIPPRIEIGIDGGISADAGRERSSRGWNLCVSSNLEALTVAATGRNSERSFSLAAGERAPGYRVTFGGNAMTPGQRISLAPRVAGRADCTRGSGMKLEVSLPKVPGRKDRGKGAYADVLTLVFEAT